MPEIPPEIQAKLDAISQQITDLTAQLADIKTQAVEAAQAAVQQALEPIQAKVQFSGVVEAALDKLDKGDTGSEAIGREQLTEALIKLAGSKLEVFILSQQGHALDNFFWRTNEGDGERTVQFQCFDPNNDHLKMTLRLV